MIQAVQRAWSRRQFLLPGCKATTSASAASPANLSTVSNPNSSRDSTVLDCDAGQFYKYTSGRWLWNEEYQFAQRHVEFNLAGLLGAAVQATGARSCLKIEKLPEGNFNKVFSITTDNDRELIAKIPNPNAGRPHFTTASEVATMDYVSI